MRFREKSGKQISKHLRKEGRVPAILFRSGDHSGELLSLPLTDIEALLRKYGLAGVGARLLELNFEEGTRKETVIIKQVHQDGVSREVINLTFMPCTPLTKVKLKVSSNVQSCITKTSRMSGCLAFSQDNLAIHKRILTDLYNCPHSQVPVRTEGEDTCPGIKRGGFAHRVFRSLDVTCLAKDIPPVFMVDISKVCFQKSGSCFFV